MAQVLSNERLTPIGPAVGQQLFDVITSGMYDNPLMIYREYIQNSVDSIDSSCAVEHITPEKYDIRLDIDGGSREIIIEDRGPGLEADRAPHILRSVGLSPKEGLSYRGFRGIGRLGGLAYCDELIFETRTNYNEPICHVSWNRRTFETLSANKDKLSLIEAIERVSDVQMRPPTDSEPPHFFRVRMKGVRRFHNDLLMNVKALTNYLSQVAPVPYDRDQFIFADALHKYFSGLKDYRCYNIILNGRKIYRPYRNEFSLSKERKDTIRDIEYFSFVDEKGAPLALGWNAVTGFLASLPTSNLMRGIRVRQGNIEIGDDHFLKDIFKEERFASWVIGEIHVCDGKLKPNARRDGYEISANYEKFLEQAGLFGRKLSYTCRQASNGRIESERINRDIVSIERMLSQSQFYLDEGHIQNAEESIEEKLSSLKSLIEKYSLTAEYQMKLDQLRNQALYQSRNSHSIDDILDGRKLRNLSQRDILKHAVTVILEHYGKCHSAEALVQHLVEQFSKTSAARRKKKG
jgi:hypothetical protein